MPVSEDSPVRQQLKAVEVADLTNAAIGRRMSMSELAELVDSIALDKPSKTKQARVWVGSVGYEHFHDLPVRSRTPAWSA